MFLPLIALAWPHGQSFGAAAVDVGEDGTWWVATDGFGLARSVDEGAAWEWICEEAVGGAIVYDVAAVDVGEAWAGTREGVLHLTDCGGAFPPGLPEGAPVGRLIRDGDGVLAAVTSTEAGGIWRCDAEACLATEGVGADLFPKSLLRGDDAVWATVVSSVDLASALWRSEDGVAWNVVHAWPDGDVDPYVLHASGGVMIVWARPRADDAVPELLRSTDGGVSFTSVLSHGTANELAPGFATPDGRTFLFGSNQGARTFRSDDAGVRWTEVSREAPAVRCGWNGPGYALTCGDHLADGVDLARTDDAVWFTPVACLETAAPAACVSGACDEWVSAYQSAAAYGGGRCDEGIGPPADSGAPPVEDCACGRASVPGWFLVLLAYGTTRYAAPAKGPPRSE